MPSQDVHLTQTLSDNAFGRVFTDIDIPGNPNNTVEICIETCISQNFTVAGTEFSGT